MEHERPGKMYQADLIEFAWEHLATHEAWILANGKTLLEEVMNFIAWCKNDLREQLHCKRAGDSKSFFERKEEGKRAIREHSDAIMKDIQHRKEERQRTTR